VKWREIGFRKWVLATPGGRVIGGVEECYRLYWASANGVTLGQYVTEKQAKKAAEYAVMTAPPDPGDPKNTPTQQEK
jgi:hypothetical protein